MGKLRPRGNFFKFTMYWLARVGVTKYYKLNGLASRNLLSHHSGWKSEIKRSAGLVPSEDKEGRIQSRSPFLVYRWPSSPCVSSHCLPSMCVCVSISFYEYTSSDGLGEAMD